MKTFVSLNILRELSANSKTVCLDENSVLSPSAKDYAREKGLVVYLRGNKDPIIGVSTGAEPACEAEKPVQSGSADKKAASGDIISIDRNMLEAIITKAIREHDKQNNKPICENPKVMKIDGDKVVMEPFPEAPAGQKVCLTDVITEREGSLGAGFMTFENAELPWTLEYDEVDYVVEGEFTIETGGKLYSMKQGDVFHIPKGTSVVFGSPSFGKVFYSVYPANWMAQIK
ncbi:MAG TPA: cupin domain-containing protein [Anaerovoracaceae bacterium]|nr:cupin domain-containing protein [Anaerovoracaceae bacterium]